MSRLLQGSGLEGGWVDRLEREADQVTSLRALPGIVVYALLALGFSLTTELGSRFPRFSFWMTVAAFVAGAVRFRVLTRPTAERGARWRRAAAATSLACVGLWAMHVSIAIHLLGIGMTTMLMMMASSGLVIGVAHALSPRPALMRACIIAMIGPPVCVTLATQAFVVGALIALLMVYALYLGHRLGAEYWESAIGRAQLQIGRDELLLSQRRLHASERLASLGRLAAGVGHEINNPLTYVLADLELALSALRGPTASGPEESKELVELVAEALEGAERVRLIVRDLRIFSEAGEPAPTAVDLNGVLELAIKVTVNDVRPRARLVRVPSAAVDVLANETKLEQVFVNLLRNAAQAIPEGRPQDHEIRISTAVDEGAVVVEIRDTGGGISPAHLERIFDPFFTTKPVGSATGLGLSIAHASVRSFGGDISVSSEPGHGTTFVVRLPLASQVAERATSRGRILVVDDEASIGTTLRRAFGPNHEVVAETSAVRALARLEAGERFDLVMCDLMMPDMTGMELFERVAEVAPAYASRFVFMTGGAFTTRATEFLERVPNVRIDKPFHKSSLKAVVAGIGRPLATSS